jgi:hypothetical protein
MEPHPSHDYELEVTSERHGLVVRLRGRVTAEAGRQLRDVIAAAAKCGVPVAVSLPSSSNTGTPFERHRGNGFTA